MTQADGNNSDLNTAASAAVTTVKPDRSQAYNLTMPPKRQAQRDSEGRSLAGRKKPLKINLDLALVRKNH